MQSARIRPILVVGLVAGFAGLAALGCSGDSSAGANGGGGGAATAGMSSGGGNGAAAGAPGTGGTTSGGAGNAGMKAGGADAVGGGNAGNGGVSGGAAGANSSGTAGAGGNAGSSKILIYGVTTGFRHGSITPACNALAAVAMTHGLTPELVGCTNDTNMPDATKLSAMALSGYGAVVLMANSGEPFGYPATTEIQNLVDYVKAGGALVAIEDADHCYDGAFNGHPASLDYVSLIGNDFVGHPGGVALATCTKVGTGPAIDQLPATFTTTDEIYETKDLNPGNVVVLNCTSSGDASKAVRPVSYVREEGAGRVFFTALGHPDASWTSPMDAAVANSRLVEDHVMPAMLWAMHR